MGTFPENAQALYHHNENWEQRFHPHIQTDE